MKNKGILCEKCPALYEPCLEHGIGDNPAHIVAIGVSPSGFSIGEGRAFYGHAGRMFDKLMTFVRRKLRGREIRVYKTYAALVGAHKITIEHIQNCQPHLRRELESIRGTDGREPVLVPLGPMALKAVGIQARKITDVVGRVMSTSIPSLDGSRKLTVVPCLSMEHVSTKPGTTSVAVSALMKAASIALGLREKNNVSLDELTKDYIYPKTAKEVGELVDMIINYKDENNKTFTKSAAFWPIAIDTETNTLHPYYHEDPRVLMLSVAWNTGKAATILLDHPEAQYGAERQLVWDHVRRLLECPKPKIFHNWKFDHKFLEILMGIDVNNVIWDTMLGEHYLEEDKKGLYSLKQLTPNYVPGYEGYDDTLHEILRGKKKISTVETKRLSDSAILKRIGPPEGCDPEKWDELRQALTIRARLSKIPPKKRTKDEKSAFREAGKHAKELRKELGLKKPEKTKKRESEGFEAIPLEVILRYAAVDADVTWTIFTKQRRRLSLTGLREEGIDVMNNLYLPASRTLSRMEFRGFAVDKEYLAELKEKVSERLKSAQRIIADQFDPNLNVNAAKQVSDYMETLNFDPLPGIDPGSTSKEVLAKYRDHYPPDDPRHIFCDTVLDYRECHKTLNTYLKNIEAHSERDGKIHCTFHLNGTATGRLASSNPNLQNIPAITCRKVRDGVVEFEGFNIKKLFIPSRPDYSIVNCDISGAELRVFTAYAQDEDMIKALTEGMDIHSLTTSKVYKIPYEEVVAKKESDPDMKKKRLACKRVVFGALYGAGPYKLAEQVGCSIEEAKELQRFLFEAYPRLREYIDGVHAELKREHQRVKTFFGRVRRFKLASLSERHAAEARREAVNFKIQSTSSDLVLSQLCEIDEHLHELSGKLLITVHDSYVMEVPTENLPKLKDFFDHWLVKRVKEKFPWLPVPFVYDLEAGPSYGELSEVKA